MSVLIFALGRRKVVVWGGKLQVLQLRSSCLPPERNTGLTLYPNLFVWHLLQASGDALSPSWDQVFSFQGLTPIVLFCGPLYLLVFCVCLWTVLDQSHHLNWIICSEKGISTLAYECENLHFLNCQTCLIDLSCFRHYSLIPSLISLLLLVTSLTLLT